MIKKDHFCFTNINLPIYLRGIKTAQELDTNLNQLSHKSKVFRRKLFYSQNSMVPMFRSVYGAIFTSSKVPPGEQTWIQKAAHCHTAPTPAGQGHCGSSHGRLCHLLLSLSALLSPPPADFFSAMETKSSLNQLRLTGTSAEPKPWFNYRGVLEKTCLEWSWKDRPSPTH